MEWFSKPPSRKVVCIDSECELQMAYLLGGQALPTRSDETLTPCNAGPALFANFVPQLFGSSSGGIGLPGRSSSHTTDRIHQRLPSK